MGLKKPDIREYVRFAGQLASGSGKILRNGLTQTKRVDYKGAINPVTEYDLKSEKLIISRVRKRYPDHAVLSEEGSGANGGSPFRWIIDPLDGTVNYSHGFPVYCVSIALEHAGGIIVGAVYDPERDELFSAGRGLGAYLNRRRIKVSEQRVLDRSLLATGFAYNVRTARKNNLGIFSRMVKRAQAVRRLGSAAIDLCWVASGRLDGFWEYFLHPWDTAAAILIVEEAGGKVTKIDGGEYSILDKEILASNGRMHNAMQRVLTGKSR